MNNKQEILKEILSKFPFSLALSLLEENEELALSLRKDGMNLIIKDMLTQEEVAVVSTSISRNTEAEDLMNELGLSLEE